MGPVAADMSGGIAEDVLELRPAGFEEEQVKEDLGDVGRRHDGDFGIASHEQRIGVVPGVAPAPVIAFVQGHEAVEVVQYFVEPAGPERRAVRQLVGVVVGHRIHDAVDSEERHAPPRSPGADGAGSRSQEQRQPDAEVAQAETVGAAHQLFQFLPVDLGGEPLRLDLALECFLGKRGCVARSAI